MNNQIYIVEYDLYLVNTKTKKVYLKHTIEKRLTTKSFENLLFKISNDINISQDSVKIFTATEMNFKTLLELYNNLNE